MGFRACASFTLAWLLVQPAAAQSLADPAVRAGAATVEGVGTNNVVVRQATDKAVIDWRAFSVDVGTNVRFVQPGSGSVTLNRITGPDTTRIDGSVLANGQVWLLNPNGVLIGSGGRVQVGGLVATTHAIGDADFMAGNYRFDGSGATGEVVNRGAIIASDGGYAVLAGNRVTNSGLIQARLGQVAMGAGGGFALDVAGDKLLSFAVTRPVDIVAGGASLVGNDGVVSAKGGTVLMTARAAADVVGGVVNTTGLVDASAARVEGGSIVLDGGEAGLVLASGTLDASGKAAGQVGGRIGVFGNAVVVGRGALVDASGAAGGGTINVGGGWQGASVGGHASSIRAGVAADATLDASALANGKGGEITVWSDVTNMASRTLAYGTFRANGGAGGGDGGRIETSGRYLDTAGARGGASAVAGRAGTWLFDPYNVEIVAAGSGNSPAIVNPGFENGLTGWTIVGSGGSAVAVQTAQAAGGTTYSTAAPSGSYFLLATGGSVNSNNGVQQSFSGVAGQSFTVYALFLGKDSTSYNDNGIVTLKSPDGTTQELYRQSISTVGANGTKPWQSQLVTLSQTGSYTITATSANIGDGQVPSQLGFELGTGSANANGGFAGSGSSQTWTPAASPSKIDVSQITGFLNAGTNVQITTTGAGTEAGNITVNAAIAKTAGAAATLRLDALGGIVVNQAIGSTSNALNVSLDAGAGGIALNNTVGTNGGTLTLNTTGASTQTAAVTTATLALSGVGGTHMLTNAGNSFTTLTGNVGSAALVDSTAVTIGGLSTADSVLLTAGGPMTIAGTNSFGGATTLATPGSITLASGGQTTTTGLLALEAGTNFVNNAGASAIATGGAGRWLIYSQAPASDTFGGLASGNAAVWGATPSSTSPAAAPAGNRYLFAATPTITVTPVATHKAYGDTLTAAGVGFATSGLVNAASYGNVFIQDQLTGTPGLSNSYGGLSAASYTGTYTLQAAQGSLAAPSGYLFAFGQSTLTVDPRQLVLAAVTDNRVYDRTTASAATPTATGLVNGDTVSGLGQRFDSVNVGNRTLAVDAGYSISTAGGANGSANYVVTLQNAIGTITARQLAASLTGSASKVYDGTTAASLTAGNYQLAGVIGGDNVQLASPAGASFDTRNAGSGKTVTASGLTLSGSDAGNYTVNASASGAIGTITAKQLAASLTGSASKVYDGTTAASLTAGNYQLAGVIGGDNVQLATSAGASFDTRNAGSGKTVTASGLTLSGSDAGNYTVNASASGAIGTITAKQLAASLTGSTSKVYDGTTAASLTAGNYQLAGVIGGDNVQLASPAGASFDTRNAGSGKTVTASGLTLSGSDAGNYTVNASASGAIGTITAKQLAASLTGSTSKVYDGTTAASLTAGNYQLAGVIGGDNVQLASPAGASFDTRNAGSGKTVTASGLTLSGSDAGNYTVNASASGAIGTITARQLAASLTGSASKVYDGTTAASLTAGNYQLAGVIGGDNVQLATSAGASFDTRNAGSGKTVTASGLTLSGSDAGNYTVNTSASGEIGTITAKQLAASLTGSASKVYDGTTAASLTAGNYQLAGVIGGDNVQLATSAGASFDTRNAGSGKTVTASGLTLSGSDAGNYTVNTSASGAIGTITAKQLAASLTGSTSKVYDGTTAATLAAGNYQLAGVIGGDNVQLASPAGASFDTRNAGSGKTVTASGLTLSGSDAGNYTVNASASGAIGTITARQLAASLTGSASKVYDGTTAASLTAGNYQLAGVIGGDNVQLATSAGASFDTRNAGSGKTVTASGLTLSGSDAGNYTVNASASGAIGTITAKQLAASLTGSTSKVYDGTTAATLAAGNYQLAGVIGGDNVQLASPAGASFDTRNAGSGKTVTASGLTLSGSDAGNYTVNASASGAIGTITAKQLAASLTGSASKVYDGTTAASLTAGNYQLAGVIGGDNVQLASPAGASFDTRNAGSGKTVTASGLTLSGSDAGNYTVNASASGAIGTITAKQLAASLTGSASKVYDGTTAASLTAGNYQLAGVIGGDNVQLATSAGANFDTRNAGSGKTVTASGLTLSGSDAGNYTVNTSASGEIGTITPQIVVPVVVQPILPPVVTPVTAPPVAPVVTPPVAPVVTAAPLAPAPSSSGGGAGSSASSAPAAAVEVAGVAAVSVAASPPSPVAATRTATPADPVDVGDPILASVDTPTESKPASHAERQSSVTVPIAGGLLGQQRPVQQTDRVPGIDEAFSGSGSSF